MQEDGMNVEEVLMFLAISVVSVFSFASIAVWVEGRRKEREAYYKAESMRRIAEMPGDGAKNVIEVMREEERILKGREVAAAAKKREGMIIGGLVNIGIGVGMMVFLYFLTLDHKDGPAHVYLSGLIMVFIGLPLLLYGLWMKPGTPAQ
jgi:hypothetical protein